MPPLLLICITAMACSLVKDDARDMDWNDEVYQELTRAIEKELKLNTENPKVVKMPEKGTFKCLILFKASNLFFFRNKT